jgi:hypothetical protein
VPGSFYAIAIEGLTKHLRDFFRTHYSVVPFLTSLMVLSDLDVAQPPSAVKMG